MMVVDEEGRVTARRRVVMVADESALRVEGGLHRKQKKPEEQPSIVESNLKFGSYDPGRHRKPRL